MNLATAMYGILDNKIAMESADDMMMFEEDLAMEADMLIDRMVDGESPFAEDAEIDEDLELKKTIWGLKDTGIISDHQLLDYCAIVINPAYVHINEQSENFKKKTFEMLHTNGIYSIGRYGQWTYCSIEDCVLDATNLSKILE